MDSPSIMSTLAGQLLNSDLSPSPRALSGRIGPISAATHPGVFPPLEFLTFSVICATSFILEFILIASFLWGALPADFLGMGGGTILWHVGS